ncbi:hypothetical protein PHLCEN_2v1764 [Hermanssonia centrifuga]|uniref:Uncharacterized protein n=1 Tax=Hermanssonia centrifuga TaxID=98765 RepID=A0A2R6RVZ2_9APHY|nr:hypothetical protein PHLCEN_2v1764 [Hermanssonia centrifuga]
MQPQNTDNPGVQGLAPNELPQHVGNITQYVVDQAFVSSSMFRTHALTGHDLIGFSDRKQLKLKETPRKIGTPRATQNVTTQREDIVDQMENEMVLCQGWDETGFGHYLPSKHPVSDADVDAAVDALKQAGHLELDAADGDFQFTEIDPTAHGNETVIYSPLVKICEVLQDLSFADKRQVSCKIEQNPNNYNESETLGANFKVDAYLKLAHSTMPKNKDLGPVCDLAVPSEYKRDRTNVYEVCVSDD